MLEFTPLNKASKNKIQQWNKPEKEYFSMGVLSVTDMQMQHVRCNPM